MVRERIHCRLTTLRLPRTRSSLRGNFQIKCLPKHKSVGNILLFHYDFCEMAEIQKLFGYRSIIAKTASQFVNMLPLLR